MTTTSDSVELFWVIPSEVSETTLARAARWLDDEERARHRAFVFEKHKREYLVTRALERLALSRVAAPPPEAWRFWRPRLGRPEVTPPCGLRYNLSNHPTLVVCAVRKGEREIGVDVEPLARGAEVLEIASTVFSERELAELRALPKLRQPDRAVSLWTLKEAYIKARGLGLSLPLQEFTFSFPPAGIEISFAPTMKDHSARWQFATFDRCGHRIAVAVEIPPGGETSQLHCAETSSEI